MKGLFIKDYRLMMKQRTAAAMILFFAVFFLITGNEPGMAVSYCIFVAGSIITGTQAYDEANHGMAYLMTLPTGRKMYVKEKFLFCLVNVFAIWLVLLLAGFGIQALRGMSPFSQEGVELLVSSAAVLLLCNLFSFVMIPAQLKFGPEKSRWVILLFVGACMAAIYIVSAAAKMTSSAGFISSGGSMVNLSAEMLAVSGVVFAVAVWAAILAVSYNVSLHIIQKKEY